MGVASTVGSWPRRISDAVLFEGLWPALVRATLFPFYRAVTLNSEPLGHDFPPPPESITVRRASDEDVPALVRVRPEYKPEALRERFQRRHECFLACTEGQIASLVWACPSEAYLAPLGLVLALRPEEVFDYDSFTVPRFRRRRVAYARWHAFQSHYFSQGFKSIVDFTTPGRRPWGQVDTRRVATIRTLRLGPFRKLWVRTCGPQAEYWRERLDESRWA